MSSFFANHTQPEASSSSSIFASPILSSRHPIAANLTFLLVLLLAWSLYKKHVHFLPLANIQGPKGENFMLGHSGVIAGKEAGVEFKKLIETYGKTVAYPGPMGSHVLLTADPKAFNYVMKNNYQFPKPSLIRRVLEIILGRDGVFSSEGDVHRRERKVMLPSFSPASIRDLQPIFLSAGDRVRAGMTKACQESSTVDVYSWMGRGMLDVIGLAGFGYDFGALDGENNELGDAFQKMFSAQASQTLLAKFEIAFPVLRSLPTKRKADTLNSSQTMETIAENIVTSKKDAVLANNAGGEGIDKDAVTEKDILSRLVKANMVNDLPLSQKLSDKELRAQITTMMLAGFETSSTVTAWGLLSLSRNLKMQQRLREELRELTSDSPSTEDLDALPYLDAFVKETLRVYPVVPTLMREVMEDGHVLPLSESIVGKDGTAIDSIPLPTGTVIHFPLTFINRDPSVWGPDAAEFRPERFLSELPEKTSQLDTPYAQIATFAAGARACIGFRFATAEIKAFLWNVLPSLEVLPAEGAVEYEAKATLVQRPVVKGKVGEGFQLPLTIRLVGEGQTT